MASGTIPVAADKPATPVIPSISRRVKREFDPIAPVIGDESTALAGISISFFFIMVV
jgi:hypothetical protein